MKTRVFFGCWMLALSMTLVPTSVRADDTYKVDPVHSMILFKIRHLDAGNIYGRFNHFSGSFTFDEANSSLAVEVKSDSVDTGNAGRDKHLKSQGFFNVKEFPNITFKSTGVKKIDDKNYEVTGELTLLNVTKPITAKIERIGTGKDPKGTEHSGFEATFVINRVEYGMKLMEGPLGSEVTIIAAIEGTK